MRSAGNFNPEWGYLAPAPSFMRTARVVLVATAIGATAGAAVVVSLIDRPAGEAVRTATVVPRAIVTSAQAAPATVVPAVAAASAIAPVKETAKPAAVLSSAGAASAVPQETPSLAPQVAIPPVVQPTASAPPASDPPAAATGNSATSAAASAVEPKHTTGMAALSESSPSSEAVHAADAPDQALIPPEPVPEEKKGKHHLASATTGKKPTPSLGSVLRRIFNPPAGRSYYPNR